jgi:Zn-dependent protease
MSAQAQRTPRGFLDRIIGIAVVAGGFAKFFAFFVSFAAYSLWFHSWRFGLGLVLMILVHELGHFFEARRQGLPVTLPTFIPFFGAFVTHRQASSPWRGALIALAGPFVGGLGAAAVWAVGSVQNTIWLVVLANIGFLLNAFNLLPIGFLDGGQTIRAAREAWRMPVIRFEGAVPMQALAPDRARALAIVGLYLGLAALLVTAMLATHPSGGI